MQSHAVVLWGVEHTGEEGAPGIHMKLGHLKGTLP